MEKRVALSVSDTERIAELARLRLSDAEKNRICSELGEMLLFASALQGVEGASGKDIGGTRTLSELRADEPSGGIAREVLLGSSADSVDGFIRVPRVVGEDS